MRIEYTKEGGIASIPALAAPLSLDTAALAPEDARALETLVEKAAFFDLPEKIGAPARGAADLYTYIVTAEDGGRSHTVRITGTNAPPAVSELVRALEKHAKKLRRGA